MSAKQNTVVVPCICLILSLAVVSPILAEDSGSVKNGFYVGASFLYNSMSGDFDNTSTIVRPAGIVDVPDLDNGPGFGVVIGGRRSRGALELGYQRTTHDTQTSLAQFQDLGRGTSEASYSVVDLNLKIDVFARNRLRPYVLIGAGIPWLTIEADKLNNSNEFEDVTFIGFCLNAGAGVAYYFHPQWAVTGGGIVRWNWFTSGGGEGLDSNLTEQVIGFSVGVAYTF